MLSESRQWTVAIIGSGLFGTGYVKCPNGELMWGFVSRLTPSGVNRMLLVSSGVFRYLVDAWVQAWLASVCC